MVQNIKKDNCHSVYERSLQKVNYALYQRHSGNEKILNSLIYVSNIERVVIYSQICTDDKKKTTISIVTGVNFTCYDGECISLSSSSLPHSLVSPLISSDSLESLCAIS